MDELRTITVECAAVLFDMDGTLVDSTAIVERQWARFAKKYGLDYGRIMEVSHGRRNSETIRDLAPHLATAEVFAQFDEDELRDRGGAVAIGGAARLLQMLPLSAWAVVTSASVELASIRLQDAGLPLPRVLVGANSVSKGKPHPEGYLLAASRLNVLPQNCLVFEDTPAGLESAAAAGMRAIGITTTYAREKLQIENCVRDFETMTAETNGNTVKLSFRRH